MSLSIYCSKCDKQVEITKHTVYKEYGSICIRCDYCGDEEEAD